MSLRAHCPFSATQQAVIGDLFRGVVVEKEPALSEFAISISKASVCNDAALESSIHELAESAYTSIFDDAMSKGLSVALADYQTKLVDVEQRVRRCAGIAVVNAINQSGIAATGDTFEEVIQRFAAARLSADQVQGLVDHAVVWPSLTTHLTNPTSSEYTRAGMALSECLDNPTTTRLAILEALRAVRDAPIDISSSDGQKTAEVTSAEEAEELLAVMSVLYAGVATPYSRLRASLDKCGYASVILKNNLLDLNVWGAGDGDCTPPQTAATLAAQVAKFRAAIVQLYAADLRAIESAAEPTSSLPQEEKSFAMVSAIVGRLEKGAYLVADELRSDLDRVPGSGQINDAMAALKLRVRTFGLHFARTDLRHNSKDIMTTVSILLEWGTMLATAAGDCKAMVTASEFLTMSVARQTTELSYLLHNTAFCKVVQAISPSCEELQGVGSSEDVVVATRLFQRVRVVAAQPESFQKLIVVDCHCAANVLAALLLLQLGGNIVAAAGASTNIVPEFESREDLVNAPLTIQTLVSEPIFLLHLKYVGCLLLMVAKSDKTLRSGPGIQGVQELMYGLVLAMDSKSYDNVPTYVMLGGGDDQMRGGSRIVEWPHVVMMAASRVGSRNHLKVAITIEGRQLQLLFGSTLHAEHFIEAFSAQALLASSRIRGYLPWHPSPSCVNEPAALRQTEIFFKVAMDRYESLLGSECLGDARRETLLNYLADFPPIIVSQANKTLPRAISLDQIAKHDGAYITATLGVAAALKELNKMLRCGAPEKEGYPPLSPLRHAYLGNKSFRDFVRLQAMVLFLKDYTFAWALRGGEPSASEKENLAFAFVSKHEKREKSSSREVLAFIEREDAQEAALLCLAIRGRDVGDFAPLGEPLQSGWPDVAEHIAFRRQQSWFSRWLEKRIAQQLRAQPDQGETFADADVAKMALRAYMGANAVYGTPIFSLAMWDPQKENANRISEKEVATRLTLPVWAQSQDTEP